MWLNLQNYFNFNKDFVAQLRKTLLSSSSRMSGGSPDTAEKYLITVALKFAVIKSNTH